MIERSKETTGHWLQHVSWHGKMFMALHFLQAMFCKLGTNKPIALHLTISGQESLQCQLPCNGKSGVLASVPPQPSHLADLFSNMNTPLHKLKIKVPIPITLCLLLSWLAVALVLTGLCGDLQQFQWLLLATIAGALLQAIAIIFGGNVSCVVTPNAPN
jgi:hypothetical protein